MTRHAKALSRLIAVVLGFWALYAVFRFTISARDLMLILNGVCVGALVSIGVAYGPLVWRAIAGDEPLDNARVMAIGFAALWFAIGTSIANSLTVLHVTEIGLLVRYQIIMAAGLQVFAPDLGFGWLYGRDRRTFIGASIVGLLTALGILYMQPGAVV